MSNIISTRRLSICGHCIRHNEEAAHNLIFLNQKDSEKRMAYTVPRTVTFVDNLKEDTDL